MAWFEIFTAAALLAALFLTFSALALRLGYWNRLSGDRARQALEWNWEFVRDAFLCLSAFFLSYAAYSAASFTRELGAPISADYLAGLLLLSLTLLAVSSAILLAFHTRVARS